ncbi:MAG: hypothetical protein ACYTER_11135, partial [Planctomycetota bacterium]
MRKGIWGRLGLVVLIITVLAVIAMIICNLEPDSLSERAGWSRGKMAASERGYYKHRLRGIGDKWRQSFDEHGYNRDGRAKEGYDTFMVIDTIEGAMWLESKGSIAQQDYCELPAHMKWIAYRTTHGKNEDMPPVLRFKMRGIWSGQEYPEMFCLHGVKRASDSFSIYVTSGHILTDYGGSGYTTQNWKSSPKTATEEDEYFKTLFVDDQEWQEYQDKYGVAVLPKNNVSTERGREAAFYEILEKICQHIEIETSGHDYELRYLHRFEITPNYSAIKGELDLGDDNSLLSILPGQKRWIHNDHLFRAQLIGEDMWYVQTFPDKNRSVRPKHEVLNYEFVMQDGIILSPKDVEKLPIDFSKRYPVEAPTNSDWKITMANGVEVELLGICSSPTFGGSWWGPDGNPLDYQPHFGTQSVNISDRNRKSYEIAFRRCWPAGTNASEITTKIITPNTFGGGSGGRTGGHPENEVFVIGLTAEKEVTEVDIKVEIGVQEQKKKTVI